MGLAHAPNDLPEVAAGVREGDVLAGKYRISKVLGAGGMGVVVAAHHIYLDEKVAIKFLLPEVLGNSEAVARFTQEARASVKIKNEHVVRVIDVGTLDAGAPYMVMEYLDGGDLGAWVEQRGPLPVEQVAEFVIQACEALAEAHQLGIIHRDLKPSNLFCVRRSDNRYFIKVLDFGISKALGSSSSAPDMGITKTTAVIGSPLYMSPEQMQSAKSVDIRTDIWSLGIVLYELLTGSAPFRGDTMTEVCSKVITQATPSLLTVRSEIPVGLDAIVRKCLEKSRDMRYSNVAEVARALGPFAPRRARATVERVCSIVHAADLSQSNSTIASDSERNNPSTTADTMSPPLSQTSRGTQRARVVSMFVLFGLLAIALIVGTVLIRSQSTRPVASAAASASFELNKVQHSSAATSAMVALPEPSALSTSSALAPVAMISSTASGEATVRPPARARLVKNSGQTPSPTSDISSTAAGSLAAAAVATTRSTLTPSPVVPAAAATTRAAISPTAVTSPKSQWGGRL